MCICTYTYIHIYIYIYHLLREECEADGLDGQEEEEFRFAREAALGANSPEAPFILRAATTTPSRALGGRLAGRSPEEDEDDERERRGFALGEGGAMPSGRSSVPSVRGTRTSPLPETGADEGIELDSLKDAVLRQIERALMRSLRGGIALSLPVKCESRQVSLASGCSPAASRTHSTNLAELRDHSLDEEGDEEGEEGEEGDNDEESLLSPSPRNSCSPSPCPSPAWLGVPEEQEELLLEISVRLCASRCGTSTAVLELNLGHCARCVGSAGRGAGCCCWPTPRDAEARLLAHFARHSLLRLAPARQAVRVLLEPLGRGVPEDSEEERE